MPTPIRHIIHIAAEAARAAMGGALFAIVPRRGRLRMASVFEARRWSLAGCLQCYLLAKQARLDSLDPPTAGPALANLVSDDLIADYRASCDAIPFGLTGIYPTDGVVLWGLVRRYQPDILVETGTGTAVSSQICLKALQCYHPDAKFFTIGEAAPSVVETAERNLAPYRNAEMIKGRAPADLIPALDRVADARIAFFIDGPKGSSPDFRRLLDVIAERTTPAFIAVHDCEQHIPAGFDPEGKRPAGAINPTRAQLVSFFEERMSATHDLTFMDNAWCERHDALNDKVYRAEPTLKPYTYKGTKQRSHSPFVAVIAPRSPTGGR